MHLRKESLEHLIVEAREGELGIRDSSGSDLKACASNILWLGVGVTMGRRGQQSLGRKFQGENKTMLLCVHQEIFCC